MQLPLSGSNHLGIFGIDTSLYHIICAFINKNVGPNPANTCRCANAFVPRGIFQVKTHQMSKAKNLHKSLKGGEFLVLKT